MGATILMLTKCPRWGKETQQRSLRAKEHHRNAKPLILLHICLICDGILRLGSFKYTSLVCHVTILSVLGERGTFGL